MNADGTDVKLISEKDQAIAEPDFILNGEKIAYIQKGELYIMNLDGSSKKKISIKSLSIKYLAYTSNSL